MTMITEAITNWGNDSNSGILGEFLKIYLACFENLNLIIYFWFIIFSEPIHDYIKHIFRGQVTTNDFSSICLEREIQNVNEYFNCLWMKCVNEILCVYNFT
jgi:hypothetical protein